MLHPSLIGARACVFDAGGTLIHPDWPRLARMAAGVAGREFGADEMRRAMCEVQGDIGGGAGRARMPTPEEMKKKHWVFRRVFSTLGLDERACDCVADSLDSAHDERHLWCGPDPDASRVLEELKREGLMLAVISNTDDGRLSDALAAAGLASHFDLLVDSHLVSLRKPDPAVFLYALGRLGVEPREAAFVGDSYEHDALAARDVGMRAVLLDPLRARTECDCARIESLADLIRGVV